jgi:outer membrane protein
MRAEGIAMSWAMKMRRVGRNAVALIVAGGFALLPPAVAAETLADTLIAAYRNANLLDRQRAVVRAADEDVAQAVAALRPVVAIAGSASDTYRSDMDATLSLTADLLLFDGGASRLAIEAARESVLATRAALVAEEQTVLLDAVVAYMDFRRDTQALSVAQNNVRVIARELEAARDRFEVGEITRTDVSQAEARLAEARSNLAVTRGDVEVSRAAFNLAVGELPGDLAPPPPEPALPASLDRATALGRDRAPAIRQAQHNVRAAEINVARADAAMRPSLRVGADLSYRDNDDIFGNRDAGSARLSLNVPIYQGGRLSSLYRQAVANAEAARAGLLFAARNTDSQVARAWSGLQVARASIVAREQQIAAAQLAFEGVQEEATLGARTTLDVLDAEQELLDARLLLLQAERTEYVAVYGLLASMGLLTADHLGLDVPRYDPSVYYRAVEGAPSELGDRLDRVLKATGRE